MPTSYRLVLGWGEIAGCVLMLIPRTAVRGAWVLVAVFVLAVAIHLLHGMYEVGNLAIYIAAAWAVAVGKGSSGRRMDHQKSSTTSSTASFRPTHFTMLTTYTWRSPISCEYPVLAGSGEVYQRAETIRHRQRQDAAL